LLDPQPPNSAAAAAKFTAAENPPKKNSAGYNLAIKNSSTAARFFPAAEFYIVNSVQKYTCTATAGDKMVSGRKKCKAFAILLLCSLHVFYPRDAMT